MALQTIYWWRFCLIFSLSEPGPTKTQETHEKQERRRDSPTPETSSINFEPFFLLKIWIWWYPSLTPKNKQTDAWQMSWYLSKYYLLVLFFPPYPCGCWQYITAFDPSCLNVCWMSHKFSNRMSVCVCVAEAKNAARNVCGECDVCRRLTVWNAHRYVQRALL